MFWLHFASSCLHKAPITTDRTVFCRERCIKQFVVALSCKMSKKYFVRQPCDNRTRIVSCLGLFFRFSFHGMRVLLSCHCRVAVVRLACHQHCDATLKKSSWNMPGSIRMNPTKSPADSRSNSYISALYFQNIRRPSIHLPTNIGCSFTVHGLQPTLTGLCFALVGV